jgi:DNA-binding CsgD family transcriptional regulator
LGDLLQGIPDGVLAALPNVQRQALSAALLLDSAPVVAPSDRVVAVGVLGVLRAFAQSGALLLAIDDIQWLDSTSRTVLTYALRRLDDDGVRILATRRTGDAEASVAEESCLGIRGDRLSVGPISVGALQRIVRSRLELPLSRPILTRLHSATGGNPMVAVEMGRALERRGEEPAVDKPLPVPSDVRLLVADRLDRLSGPARDLLMTCSAITHPTVETVAAALHDPSLAAGALSEVVELGVMEVDGIRIRFTHPLVASVAYAESATEVRQALHRRLAAATADPEERARHLALGSTGPDAEVADALELAARHARSRGRRDSAAELAGLAISRTPAGRADDLRRRQLAAAEYLFHVGFPDRARLLAVAALDDATPGSDRVMGLLLLATIDYWTGGAVATAEWCEQGRREAGRDRLLLARCHAALADLAPYDAPRLLGHARTAVELMEEDDDPPSDVLASALKNVAYHELRLGQGLSLPLLERAALAEERSEPVPVIDRVGMCLGMLLRFAGKFAEARRWLLRMRESAEDEGDDGALPNILGHLALLECWAGDYQLALTYAAAGLDLATRTGIGSPSVTAAQALAEAHIGHIDEARRIAAAALAHDESQFDLADVACDLRSLGFADLSVEDFSAATAHLLRALSIAEELGVKEPAILRIHADAVESLVGLGRLADAERLTEALEGTGRADPTWSKVMARRCRGLLLAAIGDLPAAVTALTAALEDHPALGMPFEEARTRLWLGKVLRRAGRRSEARESLGSAEAAFRKLGTPVYADRAHAELGRLGGRVAEALQLTATETQVAELVGAGHTNQEVAEVLFVSVRTVESHLGRIYRKLGVRSRTELARALPAPGGAQP